MIDPPCEQVGHSVLIDIGVLACNGFALCGLSGDVMLAEGLLGRKYIDRYPSACRCTI
jgi:hypothetical protein